MEWNGLAYPGPFLLCMRRLGDMQAKGVDSANGRSCMWPDTETDQDFLNFAGVAATVAEIIAQAQRRPISIGVSGAWGVGKSSMIRRSERAGCPSR